AKSDCDRSLTGALRGGESVMSDSMRNPFDATSDPDRHYIWQRVLEADSDAYVQSDWEKIADDFDAENFEGIRCFGSTNPDEWRISCPTLSMYRERWLASSKEFLARRFRGMTHREAIYA